MSSMRDTWIVGSDMDESDFLLSGTYDTVNEKKEIICVFHSEMSDQSACVGA